MKAHLQYNLGSDDFSLYMKCNERMPTQLVLSKMEWVSQERFLQFEPVKSFIDGQDYSSGSISIREFVQAIMDVGWEKGMRPLGYADVKNETTAIRDHLADMRQLAFAKLNVEQPVKK